MYRDGKKGIVLGGVRLAGAMEVQSVPPGHRSSRWIDLITEQEYESCLQSDMEVDMDVNNEELSFQIHV